MRNPIKIKSALPKSSNALKLVVEWVWNKGLIVLGGGVLMAGLQSNQAVVAVVGFAVMGVGALSNIELSTESASS